MNSRGVIPDLPTELPGPRIGSADVRVAADLGRDQGGTKRHLQIQLALGPLAGIGSTFGSDAHGAPEVEVP